MTEAWKTVAGTKGLYEVSNRGGVRSLHRNRCKVLSTPPDGVGYPQVNLYVDGKITHTTVHVIELTAFAGECPPGQEARHLNDVKTDNRWPENLCWGTPVENQADRIPNGTSNRGERHGLSKLTEPEVLDIRARWAKGESLDALAARFGRSRYCIRHIVRRTRWAWLPDPEPETDPLKAIRAELARL